MATPNAVETKRTTKGGIDLSTFEDVLLYKDVPVIAEVANVQDALTRLGNDHSKLMKIIHKGLVEEAIEKERENPEGWKLMDENNKPTDQTFSGSLANSEDVNPVVLMFAKLNFDYDNAKTPEEKRAAKQSAKDMIKEMPKVLEGLRKKAAAASKSE